MHWCSKLVDSFFFYPQFFPGKQQNFSLVLWMKDSNYSFPLILTLFKCLPLPPQHQKEVSLAFVVKVRQSFLVKVLYSD